MRRLGIHSFVWTGGQTQAGPEMALETSAEHGHPCIKFANLCPKQFNRDPLARKAEGHNVQIGVTIGLPVSKDLPSDDPEGVNAGNGHLAAHAKIFIELKSAEPRRATNARASR